MIIRRTNFFLLVGIILITPFLIHNMVWLAGSAKTNGVMSFVGKRYSGQMVDTYSVIWFVAGNDTIWFNGKNNILFKEGEEVPVRYQRNDPSDAKVNIFLSVWGNTVIYGGILVVVLLVIFLHPQIIPYRSKIRLNNKKPFVQIV